MVREGETEPDSVTVTSVLKSCVVLEDVNMGRSVHGFSIRKGFDLGDVFVRNSLIDMYSKGFDVDFKCGVSCGCGRRSGSMTRVMVRSKIKLED
ncbi:hypothetical protein YC2023_067159 [Brassica napus]